MKVSKYILAVFFIIGGIGSIPQGKIGAGIIFLILGVLFLPPVSDQIKEKFKLWQSKGVRYGSYIALFFIGGALIGKGMPNTIKNNSVNKEKSKAVETSKSNSDLKKVEETENLDIENIKWVSTFNVSDIQGNWYQMVWFDYSDESNKTYNKDNDSEQKKLVLKATTYQTSYPYGSGDNPIFNYHLENDHLVVTTRNKPISEIYNFSVEISNYKKYLKLTDINLVQIFKKK